MKYRKLEKTAMKCSNPMQKENRISLLVTLDKNYIPQLEVLMTSIYINHPNQLFDIYLIHSRIPDIDIDQLTLSSGKYNFRLFAIKADENIFNEARITDRYPKEMYYRLLAAQWLPKDLDRILYLDPDTLVINSLYELWNTDLKEYLFAAASHTGKTELANAVNRLRLQTDNKYYNSGVLLINLNRAREEIKPKDIFKFIEENPLELLLPDQDILNAVYGKQILEVEDVKWNYDARNYSNYLLRSAGEHDIKWVMKNTSILHFCGREKPWKNNYTRRFGILYRHYMSLTDRYLYSI